MSKQDKEEDLNDVLFPNAFRTGIIDKEGNRFVLLDFGRSLAEKTETDSQVETMARVAVCPEDLKYLLFTVFEAGNLYKENFWETMFASDFDLEDGDSCE